MDWLRVDVDAVFIPVLHKARTPEGPGTTEVLGPVGLLVVGTSGIFLCRHTGWQARSVILGSGLNLSSDSISMLSCSSIVVIKVLGTRGVDEDQSNSTLEPWEQLRRIVVNTFSVSGLKYT